jgi:hypothetical protein
MHEQLIGEVGVVAVEPQVVQLGRWIYWLTNQALQHNGLCWLLGTSVLKIDDFALDLLVFLGAVAFTDEGMQEHFVCLHPSCRNTPCSSSPSGRDERVEVSFSRFKNTMVGGTQSLQV